MLTTAHIKELNICVENVCEGRQMDRRRKEKSVYAWRSVTYGDAGTDLHDGGLISGRIFARRCAAYWT